MKKINTILFATLIINVANAQDVITKNDSSKISTTILEVNPTEIKYQLFNYSNGPRITINKGDVAYVTYKNGMIERFNETKASSVICKDYQPNKYNLDNVPVALDSPELKIKKCEKLYSKKNYLGFNYIAFLNTTLGFTYMRDIKKANMIVYIPFAVGVGSPGITNGLYSGGYLDNSGTTKYERMNYQIGISGLFAPSMNREVNFLMGPSFNYSEYRMSVDTRYTTVNSGQYHYNDGEFKNKFKLKRQHYGVNVGFLARFSEKVNMSMLMTFGYKQDSYNEEDPFGIETINKNASYQRTLPDNVMPYVNYAWSIGYRF